MDVHEMLLKVQRGEVDLAEAEDYFKKLPYEDIGCAKIDHHRGLRSGFGEVIYSPGKTLEHMVRIFQSFASRQENVLATRSSREQFEAVHANQSRIMLRSITFPSKFVILSPYV